MVDSPDFSTAGQALDRNRPILVVGGGVSGMASAILLRRLGFPVDLVEIDPDWKVYGAGISITGPSFRAFERLGILQDVQAKGYGSRESLRIHNPAGMVVAEVPSPPVEPGLPSSGGIMRPALHQILRRHTLESGAGVRLGVTVSAYEDLDDAISVRFTDGSAARYQAMIGADGVFSKLRGMLFPDAPAPHYTGQHCWRLVAKRPAGVTQPLFFMAGPVTAGLMPCSDSEMYMWLLQPEAEKIRLDAAALGQRLRQIMAPFGGILAEIRDGIDAGSVINVRPLEALLLPSPWYRGRILLIGDAAHATTPHLASGAGIAVEDALVLGEIMEQAPTIPAAFAAFMRRRWDRCRMVVESSVEIGAMQQSAASPERLRVLVGTAEAALRAAI